MKPWRVLFCALWCALLAIGPHGCGGTETGNPECAAPVCLDPMRMHGLDDADPSREWRLQGNVLSLAGGVTVHVYGQIVDPIACMTSAWGGYERQIAIDLRWRPEEGAVDADGSLHVVFADAAVDMSGARPSFETVDSEVATYVARTMDMRLARDRQLTATFTVVQTGTSEADGGAPLPTDELTVTLEGMTRVVCDPGVTEMAIPVSGGGTFLIPCGDDGVVRPDCDDTVEGPFGC